MSIQYPVMGFEPKPLDSESPPMTTRPGLSIPKYVKYL